MIVVINRVHPFERHGDVAMMRSAAPRRADVVPAQIVAGDVSADVAVFHRAAEHLGARAALQDSIAGGSLGSSMYSKISS